MVNPVAPDASTWLVVRRAMRTRSASNVGSREMSAISAA
jgi:hypothetical protein